MENISSENLTQGCSNVYGFVAIPMDCDNLALCAIVTVVFQIAFYLIACTFKFDKVTDFAGGGNFIILALLSFGLSGTYNFRQIIVTALILLWGARLTGYLFYRIIKIGEDKRFDELRANPIKFLGFWILQILWVWIVSLPVMFTNSPTAPRPLNEDISLRDITLFVGGVLFVGFLLFEAISDQIKFNFRNKPENKGKWCAVGPWKYSRHPNYFGEILLWWSVFLMSTSILEGGKWAAVLGPIFITFLLLCISGIPLLERKSDMRYGQDPDYQLYKQSTSPLIPLPPYLYRRINKWLKIVFCCEFPCYTVTVKSDQEENQPIKE